jgi:putative transposase
MSQSLAKNYIHIVFSTKHREPTIVPAVAKDLYEYIGGICSNLKCNPVIVGGYVDHMHILCMLSKNIALANLVRDIKGDSSLWIKSKFSELNNFYWQNGYGAFSVGPYGLERVEKYILNQHEHHKRQTFQDEFRKYLRLYKVDYDERYVWD